MLYPRKCKILPLYDYVAHDILKMTINKILNIQIKKNLGLNRFTATQMTVERAGLMTFPHLKLRKDLAWYSNESKSTRSFPRIQVNWWHTFWRWNRSLIQSRVYWLWCDCMVWPFAMSLNTDMTLLPQL